MLRNTLSLGPQRPCKSQSILFFFTRKYFKANKYRQQQATANLTAWEKAKPMSKMPSPPKQWILGHAILMMKHNTTLDKFHDKLHKEYGNIVLLQSPGRPNTVCIYDPKDSSVMYGNDGKTPIIAFFEPLEFYR